MAEQIVLDPDEVSEDRALLDITPWIKADGVNWGDGAISVYAAEAQRGEIPIDYRVPNRTITIPLVLKTVGGTAFETARGLIQAKAGLLQREGGWISRRTASGGTVFADVTSATLRLGGGWSQAHKSYDVDGELVLEAIPEFYGDWVNLDLATSTLGAALRTVLKEGGVNAVIAGDAPARCRIAVTEANSKTIMGLLWGFRSRYYDSTNTAALAYLSSSLTTLDTVTASDWTALKSTDLSASGDSLTHMGSYRVWANILVTSAAADVRFAWDVGDLAFPEVNPVVRLPEAGQWLVDLGEIRLDPAPIGDHRWKGVVQARQVTSGATVSLNTLLLVPIAEGSGALQGVSQERSGFVPYSARDGFDQSAGALTGKSLSAGGTWTYHGTGDTDDFSVETTGHTAQRTAVSDTAALGRTVYASSLTSLTDQVVQVDFKRTSTPVTIARQGLLLRWSDNQHWALAYLDGGSILTFTRSTGASTSDLFDIETMTISPAVPINTWYTLKASISQGGYYRIWLFAQGASEGDPLIEGYSDIFAQGGLWDNGSIGIHDYFAGATACTRNYDNFLGWTMDTEPVMFPDGLCEIRTEGFYRLSEDEEAYGPVPFPTGDLPRLPPSGPEERPVELFMYASAGDLGAGSNENRDSLATQVSVAVSYRPSYLFVPE